MAWGKEINENLGHIFARKLLAHAFHAHGQNTMNSSIGWPLLFLSLSLQELASKEQQMQRKALEEALLKEATRGENKGATTDMFRCGKCKQRQCTYYQLQTRSADEPMTTFITCTNCNNRWKIN